MDDIYAHLGGGPKCPAPMNPLMQPMQAPQQSKQPTPVERAILLIEEKISALEKAVAGLVERLDPALAPQAPAMPQAAAPKPATPPCSDLVRALSDRANALAALIVRVESVTARVEL